MAGKKLYPPRIDGTIPPFYEENGVVKVSVPYEMNETVGHNEISGFYMQIKSVQTNEIIKEMDSTRHEPNIVIFELENLTKLTVGNYYKIQIAYVSQDEDGNEIIGYYSTVGVAKYTTKPTVTIDGLKTDAITNGKQEYLGIYSQENGDITEKVYSYNFTIYDKDGNIFDTTGELLHNHENNTSLFETHDVYKFNKTLKDNEIYKIVYSATTINGLIVNSPSYKIIQQSTVPPEVTVDLNATMNSENAYIEITMRGVNNKYGTESIGSGRFLISRASSKDNYTTWLEIDKFDLCGEYPSSYSWKDFTIEHGYTYKYSFQQYRENPLLYSNRIESNEVVAEFDHAYLFDGKRQLKIKYNPKISSFKEVLLENKTNTLGGKYPFFFRNGNVNYKEFPISGLISYHSDEEQLFLTNEDLYLEDLSHLIKGVDNNKAVSNKRDRTTNLTDYSISAERIFKFKALEFLNDGKPKLFKSPTEGNYIVRLMNSSLSPNDQLGRMLHTFSTTATEIDEINTTNLNKYGFISIETPRTKWFKWRTINVDEVIETKHEFKKIPIDANIYVLDCEEMVPGDQIQIDKGEIYQIGTTGNYHLEFDIPPTTMEIRSQTLQGRITYKYYDNTYNRFGTYTEIKVDDIPILQWRQGKGNGKDSKEFTEYFIGLDDIKHKITKYYFLNFTKSDLAVEQNLNSEEAYKIWLDDQEILLDQVNGYQLIEPDWIPKIKMGEGVCLDASIQRRELVYKFENENGDVKETKQAYEEAHSTLSDYKINTDIVWEHIKTTSEEGYNNLYEEKIATYTSNMENTYKAFIAALTQAIKEEEEKEGINSEKSITKQ